MNIGLSSNVFDLDELRNRSHVFRDRIHAGEILAGMLECYRASDALVLGIPASGIPIATTIARQLELSLDVAVVSKITLPFSPEFGSDEAPVPTPYGQ